MRKIRILYILSSLTKSNGVARFVVNYATHFDLEKFDIDILTFELNGDTYYMDILKAKGIHIHVLPPLKKSYRQTIQNIKNFFKEHNGYDIVHSHMVLWSYFIFKQTRKYHIPVNVLHSHATDFQGSIIKKTINRFFINRTIRLTDEFQACSTEAGRFLFKNKEFDLVYNAINLNEFAKNQLVRKIIRDKMQFSNKKVVGFVGRLVPQKNVFFLLKVFSEVIQIDLSYHLLIVGHGYLRDQLNEEIRRLNLSSYVTFVGEVENVIDYYSVMDVLVLPSIFEGLPFTAIEAQVIGLPVLMSTNITMETKISQNVNFIALEVPIWKNAILNFDNGFNRLINNNYDINVQSINLELLYAKYLSKRGIIK